MIVTEEAMPPDQPAPQRTAEERPRDQRPRLGPRPLPLHLMTQVATLFGSQVALPSWKNGFFALNPGLEPRAEALRRDLAGLDADAFAIALATEAGRRMERFMAGVLAYRHHPYRRELAPPPAIWRKGTTTLRDYSLPGATGTPVLVVPSLVNRAYILDLTEERSALRRFAAAGLRPFLVDWDWPGEEEMGFGLEDYILERLSPALDMVVERAGPPKVLGYCMGGNLALALSILRQESVAGAALLATPWDFHRPDDSLSRAAAAMRAPLEDAIALFGCMPVDLIQALFAGLDPSGIERKFRAFSRLGAVRERGFVALEDWLNDGVPLAGPVAREAVFDWYQDNLPGRGLWRVAGRPIIAESFEKPALVMVPARDRIVPPDSAKILGDLLPRARTKLVDTGHIGMICGARAVADVVTPLIRWLAREHHR